MNLTYQLENWKDAKVVCVPGVMLRLCMGAQDGCEYRINWFKNSTETYVHNHAHSFHTYCMAGNYSEHTWTIQQDETEDMYSYSRKPGGEMSSPNRIEGKLLEVRRREHYPGNVMFVGNEEYHTISSNPGEEALTFVVRYISTPNKTHVLSSSPCIEDDEGSQNVRPASDIERKSMFERLTKYAHTSSIMYEH